MFRLCMSAVLACCCMAVPAFATDADFEKAMARGVAGIESGEYAAAADEFRQALAQHPDDPQATLYLGIALNRSKDAAAEETLKRALRHDPASARTNLELGTLYLQRGIYEEARDFFRETLNLGAEGEIADAARRGLELIESPKSDKRWGVRLMGGGQFDDNVVLNPDGSPLPTGIARKSDWRGIISLGVNFIPVKTERFELSAGYGAYQSLHTRLTQFDLTQNQLDLAARLRLGGALTAGLAYGLEYLQVGGHDFAVNHSISPSLTYSPRDGLATQLSYRYRDTAYKDQPMFAANHDRSGETHLAALQQKIPLGDSVVIRAGYSYERELTARSYWDQYGSRLLAGVTAQLPLELVGDASAEFVTRTYGGVYPGTGQVRRDEAWSASLVMSRPIGKNFSLTAGYYHTGNDSNLSVFTYTRSITSILAHVRF